MSRNRLGKKKKKDKKQEKELSAEKKQKKNKKRQDPSAEKEKKENRKKEAIKKEAEKAFLRKTEKAAAEDLPKHEAQSSKAERSAHESWTDAGTGGRKRPDLTDGTAASEAKCPEDAQNAGANARADQSDPFDGAALRGTLRPAEAAAIFHTLSDENRVKIVALLAGQELCATDLLASLEIVQSTMSHHMKVLCEAGLVSCRRQGKRIFYSIRKETMLRIADCLGAWIE